MIIKKQRKKSISPKLKVKLNFKSIRKNIVPILKLLDAGWYNAKIARMLRMSKPHVAYYTKVLEKIGFIRREKGATLSVMRLQLKVKTFSTGLRVFLLGARFGDCIMPNIVMVCSMTALGLLSGEGLK